METRVRIDNGTRRSDVPPNRRSLNLGRQSRMDSSLLRLPPRGHRHCQFRRVGAAIVIVRRVIAGHAGLRSEMEKGGGRAEKQIETAPDKHKCSARAHKPSRSPLGHIYLSPRSPCCMKGFRRFTDNSPASFATALGSSCCQRRVRRLLSPEEWQRSSRVTLLAALSE